MAIKELVDELRTMHMDLVRLGAYDVHASTMMNLCAKVLALADEVKALETKVDLILTIQRTPASTSKPGKVA